MNQFWATIVVLSIIFVIAWSAIGALGAIAVVVGILLAIGMVVSEMNISKRDEP